MNNEIKSLENGDFEVIPLDDPKRIEFEKKRNYPWNGVSPAVNAQWEVKHEWDEWKPIE